MKNPIRNPAPSLWLCGVHELMHESGGVLACQIPRPHRKPSPLALYAVGEWLRAVRNGEHAVCLKCNDPFGPGRDAPLAFLLVTPCHPTDQTLTILTGICGVCAKLGDAGIKRIAAEHLRDAFGPFRELAVSPQWGRA